MKSGGRIKLSLGFIDQAIVSKIRTIINESLSSYADTMQESAGIAFGNQGAINGGDTFVNISTDLILKFEDLLTEKIV